MSRIGNWFRKVGRRIKGALKKVGGFMRNKVVPGLLKVGDKIAQHVHKIPVIGKVAAPIVNAANNLQQKVVHNVLNKAREKHGEETTDQY